jgi:hypothetical protein
MEKALSEIEVEIEILRAKAVQFRMLAARHREAENLPIAQKLLVVVGELEAKVVELQQLVRRAS